MAALKMDDEGLRTLVDAFYARVRADAVFGPSLQLAMYFRLDNQPIPRPARRSTDATDHQARSVLP